MSTPPPHLSTNDAAADIQRLQRVQEFKAETLEHEAETGRPARTEQEIRELEQMFWDRELMKESMTRRRKEKEADAEAGNVNAEQASGAQTNGRKTTGDGTVLQKRDHEANPVNPFKRTMG